MNYLIVMDNTIFGDVNKGKTETTEIGGKKIDYSKFSASPDWILIVYSEPTRVIGLVDEFIQEASQVVNKDTAERGRRCANIRVYFHFSNVYSGHDENCDHCKEGGQKSIAFARYPNYESRLLQACSPTGATQVLGFHTMGKIWTTLEKLPQLGTKGTSIVEFIKELDNSYLADEISETVKRFSILKHRIAHLFLSMDVDLQGIGEVKDNSAKALEYLKEVLKDKKDKFYYAKIGKLREYVKEIIERILTDKISDQDSHLRLLKALSGFTVEEESPIERFMNNLDEMVNNEELNVRTVLQPFGEAGWDLKAAEFPKIKSFHDWFCALINVLDRLQEKLPKQQVETQGLDINAK